MSTIDSYSLKNGDLRYRVRYRTPDRRQTDKRGFRTKRDAEQYAATVEVAKMRGEYVAPSSGRVSIGELGQAWLERQRGHLKPNSWRSVEVAWRIHVAPKWSKTPLVNVLFTDVQGWLSVLAQHKGAQVVRNAHSVLARILDDAVRDRRIASNPARGVKLPQRVRKPNTYLTADQLHLLARESGRYCSLVLLLGTVGLRWGEAASLRVGDIDFLRRRVVINENATGGTLGTPKGHKHRTLVIPQYVVDELSLTVRGKGRDELIWPSQRGGHLRYPATHDSWLSGAVQRSQRRSEKARAADIARSADQVPATPAFPRITVHDLRHTAASLAISRGANVKVVQRMLGHKSAAMTLDIYADLFDDDLDILADKLNESVGKMWARKPPTRPETSPIASSAGVIRLDGLAPPDGLEI